MKSQKNNLHNPNKHHTENIFEQMEKRIERKNYIASQYRVASISYALFFCLFGTVLNTIEPFKACTECENHIKIFIEIFYIFMYTVSIIWFIVICVLIVIAKRQQKVSIKYPTGYNRRLSYKGANLIDPKIEKKSLLGKFKKSNNLNKQPPSTNENILYPVQSISVHNTSQIFSATGNRNSVANIGSIADISKFHFTYDYENGTGELYMRCGAAIFSICAMIDRCLSLIQMVETYFNNHDAITGCKVTFVISMISKTTSLMFIFLQSFFIFKYANIIINYGKNSAVIGLMHIVCTNFCVSFRTIVHETVDEIRSHHSHMASMSSRKNPLNDSINLLHHAATTTKLQEYKHYNFSNPLIAKHLGCVNRLSFTSNIAAGVQEAQDKLSPYLFPCIIEYSLMSMTVFFILWESIEQRYHVSNNPWSGENSNNNSKARGSMVERDNSHSNMLAIKQPENNNSRLLHSHNADQYRNANQFTVDCGKSTTGLFVGMFVLLLTIISLITYLIYKTTNEHVAVFLSETTELFLIILSLLVVIATYIKLKCFKFNHRQVFNLNYNELLIVVGLAGIYLFGFYSIIAILNNGLNSNIESFSFLIQILSIVESSFQSVLIINGLKMYPKDKSIKKKKPARSLITLLILIDVSLWLSETFSVKKYDMNTIQLDYYNVVFWSIASSISSPLAIFFRFHASVCLSDMWKTLYE